MNLLKRIKVGISTLFASGLAQATGGAPKGERGTDKETERLCRTSASEGIVLLENNGTLPLEKDAKIAVFGRTQIDYFCVGYGSGGDVHPHYTYNLIDALSERKACIDTEVFNFYKKWRKNNPKDDGVWGLWPYAQEEAILPDELVAKSAKENDVAILVIGRSAGEDRDNKLIKGCFYLADKERIMIEKVSKAFKKTVLVIDTGNVIDLQFLKEYDISAVLMAFQGGMESGRAVADVIYGDVNPSGRLPDTIAKEYKDYPTSDNFGNAIYNDYKEDIYVGYRYFETFAKDRVLYPFGYGLSYTTFDLASKLKETENGVKIEVTATNNGSLAGQTVIQVYCNAPQGKLGKAEKVLVGYKKTPVLQKGESYTYVCEIDYYALSSYDDNGVTGNAYCYVLEQGTYRFYVGENVRDCVEVGEIYVKETVLDRLSQITAVKETFDRLISKEVDGKIVKSYEPTPLSSVNWREKILAEIPKEIPYVGDKGYKLIDVKNGVVSMEQFIAQLSDEELARITCGEGGMYSSLGADGNAGAMAGVSKSLREKGIPAVIPTDGPSGIRLKRYVCLLPCGTCLSATWNDELIENLLSKIADEMKNTGSDVLLAPGMNIHRDHLCGRNFEYFSEDPYLTGKIASAYVKGVQKGGLSACIKHFACNNQEKNRNRNDSRVSERALREIYLKGFEICVKECAPGSLMTSYNKINGVWSHYNYALNTTVLRGEWGYKGLVMTDWWMQNSESIEFGKSVTNNAYRVRAQVDVYMPGGSRLTKKVDNSIAKSLRLDGITRGELQRSAKTILELAIRYINN